MDFHETPIASLEGGRPFDPPARAALVKDRRKGRLLRIKQVMGRTGLSLATI